MLGATKWQVTMKLTSFQGKNAHTEAHCTQTATIIAKGMVYCISSTSQVMISSKVAACTSQLVAFNEHPNNRKHLPGLSKSRPVIF